MFIILGGTGHVGSHVASTLLELGEPVTVVTSDAAKASAWAEKGARLAEVDVHDSARLREVLRTGKRAFLLNPPAAPSTDTDVEERATVASILAAVDGSGLERVVVESTYGAQPGDRCGDLNVLFEFEEGLRELGVPTAVIRAAYYFSNYDLYLPTVIEHGVLPTMIPADLAIPMVAPADLGRTAATILTGPTAESEIRYVEGPSRYSPHDVARAFSAALGKPVATAVIPRNKWIDTFREQGFSEAAAASYANMTAFSVDDGFDTPGECVRGVVELEEYIADLVSRETTGA